MSDNESGQDGAILTALHVLEYPYTRSVGPVLGEFLGGLRDGRILGVRTPSGQVVVPPVEFDPVTGADASEMVEVADRGRVTTWAWVSRPKKEHPLDTPFAFALVQLDGADTPMLHAVDAGSAEAMATGMRVRARWKGERAGMITDIACFEPEAG
jgi:uncharacterized OB-fold protein